MAIFRLQVNSIGGKTGRRATAAAAYRAGERIPDERNGDLHNYSSRKDVLHTEIILPSHLAAQNMEWAQDRSKLWNAAQKAECTRAARVAREFQVTLPFELSAAQRLRLVRAFSQEVADRYKVAVDLAIHEPRPGGDPRNFHAHLLATTREVTPAGLGAKTGLDIGPHDRRQLGLPTHSQEYVAVRERWATLTNQSLREVNMEVRIDHRSLAAQGIEREPKPDVSLAALKIEQRGERSEIATQLRESYLARVTAGDTRTADSAANATQSATASTSPAANAEGQVDACCASAAPAVPQSLEDIRHEAREAWLQMRAAERQQPRNEPTADQAMDNDCAM